MTGTPALIDTLVGNLTPAPRAYVGRRLATGLGGGILVSAALALALWGPRPDFAAAGSRRRRSGPSSPSPACSPRAASSPSPDWPDRARRRRWLRLRRR